MSTAPVIRHSLLAGSRLFLDACLDLAGQSLRLTEARLLNPAYLTGLLNRHSLAPGADVRIASVKRRPLRIESSNCRNLIIDIEQARGASSLPASLYIKYPEQRLMTRWFFNVINAWALECHFCRHIAPLVPFRTPACFAVATKGSRFVLVQENLTADPSVALHTNRDMMTGPDLDTTRRCLDSFAQLHAKFITTTDTEREPILPMRRHLFLSEPMRSVSQALNRYSLAPCLKKYPNTIPQHLVDAHRMTIQHWQAALDWWFDGTLTLLHGDSHLGNFFVDGDHMGMLDFQGLHWGKGMRDVQYFLINSLPAPTLASHEQSLVEYYCDRRAAYGAPLAFEDAWRQYRGFSFHTLMTLIVSAGLGAMTEREQLLEVLLNRAVAACDRLAYSDWINDLLNGRLAPPGPA